MRGVIALIVLVIIGGVAVYGTQATLEDAGDDLIVQNETFTPDAGNVTTLEYSSQNGAYYDDDVTVYDENDSVMSNGTDYEWYASNGTIRTLTGGGLANDSTAKITYEYQQTTQQQRNFTGLLSLIPQGIAALVILVPLVFLLTVLSG